MTRERLFLVPNGDTCVSHPRGVCITALRWRDQLLRELDEQENCFHVGSVKPLFTGMLYEQPFDWLKPGYVIGGCVITIKPATTNLRPRSVKIY